MDLPQQLFQANLDYIYHFVLLREGATVKRIGQYVRNWWRWVNTGMEICVVNVFSVAHRAHLPAYTLLYLYLRHRYNLPAICIPCPLYTSVVQNHTQKGGYTAYGSSPPF